MTRIALALLALAAVAAAHGGRGGSSGTPSSGPQVFRHGGAVGAPQALGGSTKRGWETWWRYNREYIVGTRMRGPLSGGLRPNAPSDRLDRKKLREAELYNLMLRALKDKNHLVRSSAAVALGKFGKPEANTVLQRSTRFRPGESWFDVREGALYAMGLLRDETNRGYFTTIAGDKQRYIKERGFAVVGLGLAKNTECSDVLIWHLKYLRSGLRQQSWQSPTIAEEEKRRVAAHMLGYMPNVDNGNELLWRVARGSRAWGDACQGLAVTALGRRRARDYIERLFRLMANRDTPVPVQRSIPIALGLMLKRSDKEYVRRLGRFIRDYRRDRILQHFTAMALADVGGEQAVEILSGLIKDNVLADDRDRAWLYLALGRIASGSDKAKAVLLAKYEAARTQEVRAALALACGIARIKEAWPITMKLVDKAAGAPPSGGEKRKGGKKRRDKGSDAPSALPRGNDKPLAWFLPYGVLALGLHGDERALDLVRTKYKRFKFPEVQANGALAIALIRREKAIPELLEILADSGNQFVKAGVVMALGLMPHPTRALVDGLEAIYRTDSQTNTVRALAIIALGNLGAPDLIPASVHMTRRYNYHIRSQTLDEMALLQ